MEGGEGGRGGYCFKTLVPIVTWLSGYAEMIVDIVVYPGIWCCFIGASL